jgi:hypothetical protein
MARTKKQEFNAKNLESILWDTLNGVVNGTTDTKQAKVVAGLNRELLNVTKTRIAAMKQIKSKKNSALTAFLK